MLGLFFGGKWFQTSFGNTFGNIELDAALDEEHEWSAEVTMNPVEVGSPVTDHIIEQSDKLKIKGFVTDAPLTASGSVNGAINSSQVGNRTQGTFDLLNRLIKLREPMTVYTQYRIYDNMVLTALNIPRAASTGEAIEFSAEFVNIRKVATQTVDVPKGISSKNEAKAGGAKGSTSKKSQPSKDAGKKQVKTVQTASSATTSKTTSSTTVSTTKSSSTLFRLFP